MDKFTEKVIKLQLEKEGLLRLNIISDRNGIIQFDDQAYILYTYKKSLYATTVDFRNFIEQIPIDKIISLINESIKRNIEELNYIKSKCENGELGTIQSIIKMHKFIKEQLKNGSGLVNRGFHEEKFTRKRYKEIANLMIDENIHPEEIIEKFKIEFGLTDELLLKESKEV